MTLLSERKPGRQLDMVVAEVVLGWRRNPHSNGSGEWTLPGHRKSTFSFEGTPQFSTDLSACQRVLATFGEVSIKRHVVRGWRVGVVVSPSSGGQSGWQDSLPFAVCIAALSAMGVQ